MSVIQYVGDAREQLRRIADNSIHCCITSPPYFGLRDYGVDGQMGLEPTPDQFVAGMVEVFREVRRVLRDDGTMWLNVGDSYAGYWGSKYAHKPFGADRTPDHSTPPNKRSPDWAAWGVKNKDLIGIPWMIAFALRDDGWFLRQDIIWSKPNPMPESVRDRCTKAHEYLFLFSKEPRYYFDAEAMKEDGVIPAGTKGYDGKRNKRSVWTVNTRPFKGAHFATFPPALIEPCILAGCPVGGTVLDPFGGAGTAGLVADKLNRNAVLIELNPEYARMAEQRIIDAGGQVETIQPIRKRNRA